MNLINPDISVAVGTYNGCGHLAVALESFQQQVLCEVRFEVAGGAA